MSVQEIEIGGWQDQDHPEQYSETSLKGFLKGRRVRLEMHIVQPWSPCLRCMKLSMQLPVEPKGKRGGSQVAITAADTMIAWSLMMGRSFALL
jgi:hypothetical protein